MTNDIRYATFHVESIKADRRAVMSTPKVDRVGDSIDLAGWDLSEFASNPVMLYEHRRDEPVGVWRDVRIDGGALTGEPVFMPAEVNPFADRLGKMYAGNWLRAFSVGFRPLEMEPIPGTNGYRIKRAMLLECSCVTIPANTDALLKAADPAKVRPTFADAHPFADAATRAAPDPTRVKAWLNPEPSMEDRIRAVVKAMLDEMKQPAAQTPGNAPDDGADAGDSEEDKMAIEIAEAEADAAEAEALIAEIEDEA